VAEKAVRYLRERGKPVDSRTLARAVMATRTADEETAKQVLGTAFSGDPRLAYGRGGWRLTERAERSRPTARAAQQPEPDRALIFVEGEPRLPGRTFRMTSVAILRLEEDEVVAACGGDTLEGVQGNRLRRTVMEILEGAVPVIHDQPGAIRALEEWLGEPVDAPISLRRLARARLELAAGHDLEALAERLGLPWRETDDALEQADTLDACLRALQEDNESLHDLRHAPGSEAPTINWSRFAFNREDLRRIPQTPGTYQFYDAQGGLLYVGKSKNLNRRLGSYFREGVHRSKRIQRLLESLYRFEYQPAGSDLEATLREAELIRSENPERNVQRRLDTRKGHGARLRSILILEPAAPPSILRAYLIRDGRLLDRVGIGPRGGGLRRVERLLEHHFFCGPSGPTPISGPDLDVEVVVRWLAANRDRAVAFDPTDLRSAQEVIDRLRWFLSQGTPFAPDGSPIFTR